MVCSPQRFHNMTLQLYAIWRWTLGSSLSVQLHLFWYSAISFFLSIHLEERKGQKKGEHSSCWTLQHLPDRLIHAILGISSMPGMVLFMQSWLWDLPVLTRTL